MQHDHVLKKLNFDLLTPSPGSRVSGGKIFATMLLHLWFSLILISNMTMYWKKLIFYLLIPSTGSGCRCVCGGGGWSAGKIFATTLLHSRFSLILICNMTMFWKSWILIFWPHPQGRGEGVGISGQIFTTLLLHLLFSFKLILNVTMFWKR